MSNTPPPKKTPPMQTPTAPIPEQPVVDLLAERIATTKERIRLAIRALRSQVQNAATLDQLAGCLNPVTSIDGRLPFTPRPVMVTPNRVAIIENMIALAIIEWGTLARGEGESADLEKRIASIEAVANQGLGNYFAYPIERNSAIQVLRTKAQQDELIAAREKAQEAALERKVRSQDAEETLNQEQTDAE